MKLKPAHVKNNFNICFDKESNDKDPKYKYGHHVRILKFKNILQRFSLKISQKKFWWLLKTKTLFSGHMFLVILTAKKFLELFQKLIAKNKTNRVCNTKKKFILFQMKSPFNSSVDEKDVVEWNLLNKILSNCCIKWVNIFVNHMTALVEMFKVELDLSN